QVPALKSLLTEERCETLAKIRDGLVLCQPLVERIGAALVDEPPAKMDAGGYVRDGFSEELDELRAIRRNGKDYLARLQAQESARTGIPSLKVGYNRVFGYYLEITNTHRDKVPADYIRKQTLTNAERYVTPELKALEEKILTAEEKMGERVL